MSPIVYQEPADDPGILYASWAGGPPPLLFVSSTIASVSGSALVLYKPISFPSSFPNPSLVVGGTGCLDGQYGQAGWSLSADGVTLTLAATPAGEWSGGGSVSFWPGDYTERAAQWAALRTP